jgi:hypothetical protein
VLRTWSAAAILLAAGCSAAPPPPAVPAPAEAADPRPAPRLHALLINGGSEPSVNFAAHLAHLRELRALLKDAGVPEGRITIFSSDGADPKPDLVSREDQPEADFWRLRGTPIEHDLEMPLVFRSSEIPGAALRRATKAGLAAWFAEAKAQLGAGDVLLLYVTDHGRKHDADPRDNTIVLWDRQELAVRELDALLAELDPAVRVVMLMSQCFSGAFADLAEREKGPTVCGYFATTADRPAYGCFPENRGKEKAGHAYLFIRALAATRRMEGAHEAVLAGDDSPDVPLRSSDVLLARVIDQLARSRGKTVGALVEELVPDPRAIPEHAIVARIAASAGLDAPRSFAQVEAFTEELPDLTQAIEVSGRAWDKTLDDVNDTNLRAFVAQSPAWAQRLRGPRPPPDGPGARALASSLLADLAAWSRDGGGGRADVLHERVEAAEAAWYRAEVRTAAALRMRAILVSAAGRAFLARGDGGTDPSSQAALAGLRRAYESAAACEDLTLPGAPPPAAAPPVAPPAIPFPSLADDRALERALRPSWAGLVFEAATASRREEQGLAGGAVVVTAVYPASPASVAGVEVGDVVLGPPGQPFTSGYDLRTWTMTSKPGEPAPLELLRGSRRVTVTLTLSERPHDLGPPPPPPVPAATKGPRRGPRPPRGRTSLPGPRK